MVKRKKKYNNCKNIEFCDCTKKANNNTILINDALDALQKEVWYKRNNVENGERKIIPNMQDNTFTVINDTGEEIKCEILFTYENEKTGVNYIAYTDNSTDEDGNTKVYASIFDPEQEDPELLPIETEEEWQLINSILESLTDSDEE